VATESGVAPVLHGDDRMRFMKDGAVRIDAHHHFWDPSRHVYPWMEASAMSPMRRRFSPQDLAGNLAKSDIDGTVLVQALSSLDESREFLEMASRWAWVRGVVGWVDLAADDVSDQLDELRACPGGERLVGVRHQVHDEEDPRWLCRAEVRRGLGAVESRGLTYDLLLRAREIPAAIETAQALPELSFVVDHIAKPRIVDGSDLAWQAGMPGLAALPNVQVKLSGMVTEADWASWTPEDLRPFVSRVAELFGMQRMMFGSDWPVCLLVVPSYQEVVAALEGALGDLSQDESRQVFGDNAQHFYGLTLP
jgi:L-fuconolactonase